MTEARETIETYLQRLDAALRELHEDERAELLAEVRAHLEEAAASGPDSETAVDEAVRSLGDPGALARRLREGGAERPKAERAKTILGMPYNFKPLQAEEVAARIWNPADPRIFMPRVFGIGWTLNFGAIAVRLGFVRPDDEEPVPFQSVPASALSAGLVAVTLVNLAVIVLAVLLRRPLRPVPTHWALAGPDEFAPPLTAALTFLGPAVALNALAAWRYARRASHTERALWVASLAFAAVLLDGIYINGLAWAYAGRTLVFPGLPVLLALVVLFGVLVFYSRLGVRAEWRRARVG